MTSFRNSAAGSMAATIGLLMAMAAPVAFAQPAPPAEVEAPAAPTVSVDRSGLKVTTADGAFAFKVSGRIHADATLHVGDTPSSSGGTNNDATDGTELRRGRLFLGATAYEDFHWVGEVDFADNNAAVKDFFVSYSGIGAAALTAGHQKQPYSLAVEMSSNDLPFTERGIDNALIIPVIDRAIGGRFDANGEKWFVAGGFYGESVEPNSVNATEGWGASAKAVLIPIHDEDRVVHLGFRGAVRRPETDNEAIRFRDETTNMSDFRIVDTGAIEDVQEVVLFGPEAAIAFGPFSLFGEFNRAHVARKDANVAYFQSAHIGATWSLTGESRAKAYTIDSGEFKRLIPDGNFSLKHGGIGAWELAVRYAWIDLSSGSASDAGTVLGGEEQAFTTSLNWHLNPVVRIMLNWTHILETDIGEGANATTLVRNQEGKGLDVFTFRTQFAF